MKRRESKTKRKTRRCSKKDRKVLKEEERKTVNIGKVDGRGKVSWLDRCRAKTDLIKHSGSVAL